MRATVTAMLAETPAILGGRPVFEELIPLTRPTLQADDALLAELGAVLSSGMLTNGPHVAAFEQRAAEFLEVDHVVATSSCTVGLLLVFRCLSISGEVVLPSFTFMASGHALVWNGLTPVFADSDLRTHNLTPSAASAATTAQTCAFFATHVFGAPVDADGLQNIAERQGVPLVLDAAHGFGATYPDGSKVGSKGLVEVFSLSPTKPLSSGEGGLVATRDGGLAKQMRIARDYGNPGNYDSHLFGLNGRMTEMAGIIGRRNLEQLPAWLERRRELVERYLSRLDGVPGLGRQAVPAGATSTYKDFSITVRKHEFGFGRDTLARTLAAENVPTRSYFDPPLHRQTAYAPYAAGTVLPNADRLAAESLTLPLYSHMPPHHVDGVCAAIMRAYDNRERIASVMSVAAADHINEP